ncbi:hypothetical protein H696_00122 [Fonticula alba]|uniref:Misato Segment II tubulin-like domain-containing protein n=1 Tax=Fonticula alba TaxID=691883 RepID=A0A058ZDQ9_FONAL|nr:hypothetical protein H696_00122 [Fonticula alba]KCV72530.1 hypothetical protein H696_00122 [Fonticula alba]|eukprot:XP_009492231.1 hypothetical protein H696_00122 [Fonticula alba]
MREVITLQFGGFANHVSAHYWNGVLADAATHKTPGSLLRQLANGSYVPRSIVVDRRQNCHFLASASEGLTSAVSELNERGQRAAKLASAPAPSFADFGSAASLFSGLDLGFLTGGAGLVSAAPERTYPAWDHGLEVCATDTDADIGGEEPLTHETVAAARKDPTSTPASIADVESAAYGFWPQYLSQPLHDSTARFLLGSANDGLVDAGFSGAHAWDLGQDVFREFLHESFTDALRREAELCDSPAGVQLIFDVNDEALSSAACAAMEQSVADELGLRGIFSLPVWQQTDVLSDDAIRSFARGICASAAFGDGYTIPLCSGPAASTALHFPAKSPYHAAYPLALALELLNSVHHLAEGASHRPPLPPVDLSQFSDGPVLAALLAPAVQPATWADLQPKVARMDAASRRGRRFVVHGGFEEFRDDGTATPTPAEAAEVRAALPPGLEMMLARGTDARFERIFDVRAPEHSPGGATSGPVLPPYRPADRPRARLPMLTAFAGAPIPVTARAPHCFAPGPATGTAARSQAALLHLVQDQRFDGRDLLLALADRGLARRAGFAGERSDADDWWLEQLHSWASR